MCWYSLGVSRSVELAPSPGQVHSRVHAYDCGTALTIASGAPLILALLRPKGHELRSFGPWQHSQRHDSL